MYGAGAIGFDVELGGVHYSAKHATMKQHWILPLPTSQTSTEFDSFRPENKQPCLHNNII